MVRIYLTSIFELMRATFLNDWVWQYPQVSAMIEHSDISFLLYFDYSQLVEIQVFDPKMVLKAFWGSLGLLVGALGNLLGAISASLQGSRELLVAPPTPPKMFLEASGAPLCRFWLPKVALRSCGRPLGLLLGVLGASGELCWPSSRLL